MKLAYRIALSVGPFLVAFALSCGNNGSTGGGGPPSSQGGSSTYHASSLGHGGIGSSSQGGSSTYHASSLGHDGGFESSSKSSTASSSSDAGEADAGIPTSCTIAGCNFVLGAAAPFCASGTYPFTCSGGSSPQVFIDAGCESAPTGAIRFCCPRSMFSRCP